MNNFYQLNLPVQLFKNFDHGDPPGWRARWGDVPPTRWEVARVSVTDYVNSQALSFLDNLGIKFQQESLLFYGPPGAKVFIHTDGDKSAGTDTWSEMSWGINYSWGSLDSDMIWYKPKEDTTVDLHYTAANNPYTLYTDDQVIEIERCKLVAPSIVRNDIPHRVINYDTVNPRWCISLRPVSEFKSWEAITLQIKDYLLNVSDLEFNCHAVR